VKRQFRSDSFDYDYDDYLAPAREAVQVDDAKIVWPDGYWNEYELLRHDAKVASRASDVAIVIGSAGKWGTHGYYVRAFTGIGEVVGPVANDRLEAWRLFIKEHPVRT